MPFGIERGFSNPQLGNENKPVASSIPEQHPSQESSSLTGETYKMRYLRQALDLETPEELRDFLNNQYQQGKSFPEISRIIEECSGIKVTRETFISWFRRWGLPTRNPAEAMRLVWQNPTRKSAIVAKILSLEARKNRAASLRKTWQHKKASGVETQISAAVLGRKKQAEAHRRQLLGGDPASVLRGMSEQGLSAEKIARQIERSPATVLSWMKQYGIAPPSPRERGKRGFQEEFKRRKAMVAEALALVIPLIRLIFSHRFLRRKFTERELMVIKERYLNSTQGQPSLTEVGERLGISRQRVHQLEKSFFRKLKWFLETLSWVEKS